MRINAEFDRRVVIDTEASDWIASPMPGVDRRPLDRIGGEVARATSIVRYAPGSAFSPHIHHGGEEFLVLDGVFQDEHGDYPAGTYVRNPPQSRHIPASAPGCTIFVKLWQFDPDDRTPVQTDATVDGSPDPDRPGVQVLPLFRDAREVVRIEQWRPGTEATIDTAGGAELLLLEGSLQLDGTTLPERAWARLPDGDAPRLMAGAKGARLWLKSGHLRHITVPPDQDG
jgi:anti-sigma factor ChrR (cupin superfamily)